MIPAVVVVFLAWTALVVVLGAVAVAAAPRLVTPGSLRAARSRASEAIGASIAAVGRVGTGAALALAMWSVVIILGWVLGIAAGHLEDSVDRPAFRWWRDHHLGGTWSTVWWKLTDIGAPDVTFGLALGAALVASVLYRRPAVWWAPGATLLLAWVAERYSQVILKLVVHRGHPPTTLGTWPSGGMGRVVVVYGLIIYFLVKRFWPESSRMWATGWTVLALCASVEAYARLNNLEHWTTDVIGGALYGLLLLTMMIITYSALGREQVATARAVETDSAALPRERAS